MAPDGRLRVALLTPCYWPEVRRGSERFVHELGSGLLARGHEPRIVTSHRGPRSTSVEDGIPIVRNRRPPDGRLRRRRYEDHLTHVPFSYLSLRRGRDDVAHAVFPTDALAAVRWSAETGRPAILSYMGIPDFSGLRCRRWRLEITVKVTRRAAAVVALSEAAAAAFRRWLGVDARVIPPGVDLSTFELGERRAEKPTIVCAAAVAEPRKRVPLLVDAFARVRRERPDARLVLSRPRDRGLAERIASEQEGVELVDLDERHVLARTYGEAWVSALPSTGEAFGLVLAEALACGTPVVATDAGGMSEVVDRDSIGRLFDGHGPDSLARALLEALELAEDPSTRAACRVRAEDFSTDRTTAAYEQLYRELLA